MAWSLGVRIAYIIYYALVFTTGFLGNALIILTVFKFKKMRNVVNLFLMNLAVADIIFVILSLFDALAFILNDWQFGEIMCRIQGAFIEVSYTVSVLTLSSVAVERYMAICRPYTKKRTKKQCVIMLILVWIFALSFCAALFYGYSTELDDGRITCSNTFWPVKYRFMFYVVHSVIVYLLPLVILIICHVKVSRALALQERRLTFTCLTNGGKLSLQNSTYEQQKDESLTNSNKELYRKANKKKNRVRGRGNVIRLLAVVTLAFFIFWTPFVVIRLCMYGGVVVSTMLWRGSQLLMFGNTAANVFIYSFMSPSFRTSFKLLFTCNKEPNVWSAVDSSKSFELSETFKSKTEIKNM